MIRLSGFVNLKPLDVNEVAGDHDYSRGALESVKSYTRMARTKVYEATDELNRLSTVMKAWPSTAVKVKKDRLESVLKKLKAAYDELNKIEKDLSERKEYTKPTLTEAKTKIAPPSKIVCGRVADQLERTAKKELGRMIKDWMKDGDDEMVEMTKNDLKDHLDIVKLIRAGKLEQAADKASDLDTSSRDTIPVPVFDFLMKHDGRE